MEKLMESFNQWYINVIKTKYVEFSGRARRKEYWMFVLFNCIIAVILTTLASIDGIGTLFTPISSLYSLAVLCPGLAISVRRLHDIGRPGTHLLFALIPLVGAIIVLIWAVKEGTPEANEYGPNPKAAV